MNVNVVSVSVCRTVHTALACSCVGMATALLRVAFATIAEHARIQQATVQIHGIITSSAPHRSSPLSNPAELHGIPLFKQYSGIFMHLG